MDRSLAHSIAWRAITNWASQILSWASLLIVVRLLAPADFGIAAMALIIFPYLRYLSEIGIPATVVTFRDMSEDQLAQLNTVGLVFALAFFGVAATLAHPLAAFFRIPGLAFVTIVACLALVPQGFRAVSEGLLNKEMRFGLLSWFEAIRSIVAALTTLALAYCGFGYWALILGNLLATLVRSVLIVVARPHRFAIPRLSTIRKELLFGWHVLVSVLAWSAYERLDNLTAGRVLGQAALGFYAMAWNLANVPLEKVTSLVTTIIPSYLAAVQNDPASLRRYLRTLTEPMALATFPATIGLALVANDLVPVAMGNKWHDAILPLQVLGLYAGIRSIVAPAGVGDPARSIRYGQPLGNWRYRVWLGRGLPPDRTSALLEDPENHRHEPTGVRPWPATGLGWDARDVAGDYAPEMEGAAGALAFCPSGG